MANKIKNPDKYIKALKTKMGFWRKQAYRNSELIDNIRGQLIVSWETHTHLQSCRSLSLHELKPGDQIAIIGKVTKTESWIDNGCNNEHSQITYELQQTRRINDFFP